MKHYVLDTSTLIYDPTIIIEGYPGDELVIPMTVIRELDKIKVENNSKGERTRKVINYISQLKDNSQEEIIKGIPRPCGGTLRIELNHILLKDEDNEAIITEDDKIITVTKNLSKEGTPHILMTQDKSMSIIAETWGVSTTQHSFIDNSQEIPTGIITIETTPEVINELYENEYVDTLLLDLEEEPEVNTGVILKSGSQSAITIADGLGHLEQLPHDNYLFNLSPRGVEQKILAGLIKGEHNGDYPEEFLASVSGRPGSGKTTIALSSGLSLIQEGRYERILIFRPTVNLSRNSDLGYLPGGIDDKLAPWKEAINDVLRDLGLENNEDQGNSITVGNKVLPLEDIINIEPINYIRGRTFTNSFIIIDEAQNLEPGELRTLLTRLGKGSACVMTWDQGQIDNNFIRSGKAEGPLTILNKTRNTPNVFHINLPRSERGGISELFV